MSNSKLTRILFVCLGNICRSPAAHGVMEDVVAAHGMGDRVEIDSAGTYGGHAGDLPDPRMRTAASRRGYNLTHRARKFREEDFLQFDKVIVMDDMNYENVSRLAPERAYLARYIVSLSSVATIPSGAMSPTRTMRDVKVLSWC